MIVELLDQGIEKVVKIMIPSNLVVLLGGSWEHRVRETVVSTKTKAFIGRDNRCFHFSYR